jgi:hypothetical protein
MKPMRKTVGGNEMKADRGQMKEDTEGMILP